MCTVSKELDWRHRLDFPILKVCFQVIVKEVFNTSDSQTTCSECTFVRTHHMCSIMYLIMVKELLSYLQTANTVNMFAEPLLSIFGASS